MIYRFILLMTLTFSLFACGGSIDEEKPKQCLNVFHYGESTVNQLGDRVPNVKKPDGTPMRCMSYVNRGSDGQTIEFARDGFWTHTGKKFQDDMKDLPKGSVVILNWRINNSFKGLPTDAFMGQLFELASIAKTAGMYPILQTPNRITHDSNTGAINLVNETVTAIISQPHFDFINATPDLDYNKYLVDGIHPTGELYDMIAYTIAAHLAKL